MGVCEYVFLNVNNYTSVDNNFYRPEVKSVIFVTNKFRKIKRQEIWCRKNKETGGNTKSKS